MYSKFKILFKWIAYVSGALVILAAIALGAFRLVAADVPKYKANVQAWVMEELNLSVDYSGLDLRLGLGGPELLFRDAALTMPGTDQPFVLARSAFLSLDPLALLFERSFVPTRLGFEGIELSIERASDGRLQVVGGPQQVVTDAGFAFDIPQQIRLEIRDSNVVYRDAALNLEWQFNDVAIAVEQEFRSVTVSLIADPPAALGSRLEATASGTLNSPTDVSGDWRASLTVRDADLAVLRSVFPGTTLEAGRGDITAWLHSNDSEIVSGLVDLNFRSVIFSDQDNESFYDRIAMTAEWFGAQDSGLISFNDVNIRRPGVEWPRNGNTTISWDSALQSLQVDSDYLSFADLTPIVSAFPDSGWTDQWHTLKPSGVIEGLEFDLVDSETVEFSVAGEFSELGFTYPDGNVSISGVSGDVRADSDGGTLTLDSDSVAIESLAFLPDFSLDGLRGIVLWRAGRDIVRLVTDDMRFGLLQAPVESSLELTFPIDGGAPSIDLDMTIGTLLVADVMPFIVSAPLPTPASNWLQRALGVGQVDSAEINLYGALDEFPFDNGNGQFSVVAKVSGGAVDYTEGWPIAEGFDGELEFLNAGFKAHGRAQVLNNISENIEAGMADFRAPELTIGADTNGPLADVIEYLLTAPKIAEHLGPEYARLSALDGQASMRIDLRLPLPDFSGYSLEADLSVVDGEVMFAGFGPHAHDLNGALSLREGKVTGENITATFIDGPAYVDVVTPESTDYRARINVRGEVTADAVAATFNLPYADQVAGQTQWQGHLLIPETSSVDDSVRAPAIIEVTSNLSGVALYFPEPFAKPPADASNLTLGFVFGGAADLQVESHFGGARHLVAEFNNSDDRLAFARAALSFGPNAVMSLPPRGLAISGEIMRVDLDQWLSLPGSVDVSGSYGALSSIDMNLGDVTIYGQTLGQTSIRADFNDAGASIDIDSAQVAGTIELPPSLGERDTVYADLDHLYLAAGRGEQANELDPRRLPGLEARVADMRFGTRNLGAVEAIIETDPLGLRLASITAQGASFAADGSGSWLVSPPAAEQSRIAININSTDVAASLGEFGLDPILSGTSAQLTASLSWPGGPDNGWMERASGDIAVAVNDGSMLDIQPGAGRIVGLMSIVALPRRLALDFRDVFNRGFVFDEISADFTLINGDAYTDNLKLSGPAAEIGVVGRTGLRDRDFSQQAVVTAEPSNMLPTVGGLIGGPGVGAALLIFTRIFKEPLKGIGRASYCITGSWDEPSVERVTPEQIENGTLCAELPAGWVSAEVVDSQ